MDSSWPGPCWCVMSLASVLPAAAGGVREPGQDRAGRGQRALPQHAGHDQRTRAREWLPVRP